MFEIAAVLLVFWVMWNCVSAIRNLPSANKRDCPVKFNIVTGEVKGMRILRDFHRRHPNALRRSREKAEREGVPVHKLGPMMTIDECFDGIKKGLKDIERAERFSPGGDDGSD